MSSTADDGYDAFGFDISIKDEAEVFSDLITSYIADAFEPCSRELFTYGYVAKVTMSRFLSDG